MNSNDYSEIDLTKIPSDYIPRSLFQMTKAGYEKTKFVKDYYLVNRMMVDTTWERTYIPCVLPKYVRTVQTCLSNHFEDINHLITFSSLSFSIIYDFIIKIKGRSNILFKDLLCLPFPEKIPYALKIRALRLICITSHYADLWERFYNECFKYDFYYSKNKILYNKIDNPNGTNWNHLEIKWSWNTPIRTDFGRRQLLLEIDVITAIILGLSLDDLFSIYQIQFKGIIRKEQETLVNDDGMLIKSNMLNSNDNYYKLDRLEDYKIAWAHFESIFNDKKSLQ